MQGLIGFLLLVGKAAIAQPIADSSSIRLETQRLGINTFSMGTAGDYRLKPGARQNLSVGLSQYAIYNRAIGNNPFITNNLSTSINHKWGFRKKWILENDAWQTSFFANSTRLAQYMSKLRFKVFETPKTGLFIQGGAGLLNDKRLNNNNFGPIGEVLAEYFGQGTDSTFLYRVNALAMAANITPRHNERLLAGIHLTKLFPSGGLLGGEAGYLRRKVEDFLGTDIQSIISDTTYLRARFKYGISPNLLFSSENEYQTPNRSFFYRNIPSETETRNVQYAQDEYQTLNTLTYNAARLKASLSFESRQRNRAYGVLKRFSESDFNYLQQLAAYNQRLTEEQIKDITEQFTTYTADVRWRVAKKHTLKLNYVAQLLRVDTRSNLNNQDRDEILYAGELSYEWRLKPGFLLIQKTSASLRHLIFIEASQSSENYVDRIIRWEPGFRYSYKNLNWNGQLGIWATYQVRDFDNQQDKNRSNRVLIMAHQLDYQWNTRWKLLGDFLRRENRLSQLNWERFSESPIDTVTIYDVSAKTQYQQNNQKGDYALQVGYRAYWQIRKSKASLLDPSVGARLIYLKNYVVQQGPQIRFIWNKGSHLRLQTEFWLQWSSQFNRYTRSEEVYIGTSYTPELLAFKDSRFLPYFTISATWFLHKR